LSEEDYPMARSTSGGNYRSAANDERVNEAFHTLLREAAAEREGRARVQAIGDAVADRQASADLLALARGGRAKRMPAAR
jgi:hypothetical protein